MPEHDMRKHDPEAPLSSEGPRRMVIHEIAIVLPLVAPGTSSFFIREVDTRDPVRPRSSHEEDAFYYRCTEMGGGDPESYSNWSPLHYYGECLTPQETAALWNGSRTDQRTAEDFPCGSVLLAGGRCVALREDDIVLRPLLPQQVVFMISAASGTDQDPWV